MLIEKMGVSTPKKEIKKEIDEGLDIEGAKKLQNELDREDAIKGIEEDLSTKEGIERMRKEGAFPDLIVTDNIEEMVDAKDGGVVPLQPGEKYPYYSKKIRVIAISENQKQIAEEWVDNHLYGAGRVWLTVDSANKKDKDHVWDVIMGGVFNGGSNYMYGEKE